MNYTYIASTVAALVLGFLTGLLTFKRSLRWCPVCGATLLCPDCARQRKTTRHPAGPGVTHGSPTQ